MDLIDGSKPISTKFALTKLYKFRKKITESQKVLPGAEGPYLSEGWEVFKQTKRAVHLCRKLPAFKIQENRFWCFLYDIGYKEFSPGSQFKLPLSVNPGEKAHQIDVFAKDEETFVVVECKQRSKDQSLDVFLDQHSARQAEIIKSVRDYYENPNLKPIFIFVTEGVEWTDEEIRNAKFNRNTHIVTASQLDYLEEIGAQLKGLARYQFHAEFLQGQEIDSFKGTKISAVKTVLNGKPVYQFSIAASDLIKISFVNHRKLRARDAAPSYQRTVGRGRLSALKQYVSKGGYFPNSILVSLNEDEDGQKHVFEAIDGTDIGTLTLPALYKALRVIDGQHRLFGSAAAEREDAKVLVVLLINPGRTEEARLFRDINKEQKGVNASLLSDLEGDINWGSKDQKLRLHALASRLAERIMTHHTSPFIGGKNLFTQAELKKGILNSQLIGVYNRKTGTIVSGAFSGADDVETIQNAMDFLFPYFDEIRKSTTALWNNLSGKKLHHGHPRSNVFVAGHLKLIGHMLDHMTARGYRDLRHAQTKDQLSAIKPLLKDYINYIRDLSADEYAEEFTPVFGSGGKNDISLKLALPIRRANSDFTWAKLDKYAAGTSKDLIKTFIGRAEHLASLTKLVVLDRLDAEFEGDFFTPKHAPVELLNALNKRISKAPESASSALRDHFEFADINRYLWPESKLRRKLKVLSIPTSYSLAQVENNGWMYVVTKLTGKNMEPVVSEEDQQVIAEAEHQIFLAAEDLEPVISLAA